MSREALKEVRVRALGPVTPESCVLVLEELKGPRLLPIFTSMNDGEAIARQISGYTPPRPFTHDLLAQTIQALGIQVDRIVINDLKDGAFFARIELARTADGRTLSIDSRPTDAVNLALRAGCKLFVAEHVFTMGDAVLKPIEQDEREKFARDLETLDLAQVFADLENKPAPKEAGHPPTATDEAGDAD